MLDHDIPFRKLEPRQDLHDHDVASAMAYAFHCALFSGQDPIARLRCKLATARECWPADLR